MIDSSDVLGFDERPGEPSRRATPGELCTCGRPAVIVLPGGPLGDTGVCATTDGSAPLGAVCSFCDDSIDHTYYWSGDSVLARITPCGTEQTPQGGRCPCYRLRLVDPSPVVFPESVRRYDRAADDLARAPGRLRRELLEVFSAAGLSYGDCLGGGAEDGGNLDDQVFVIAWNVCQVLASDPGEITGHEPRAGTDAARVLAAALQQRLGDAGVAPRVLAGLDPEEIVEVVSRTSRWTATIAHDRPLLLARTLRRALDPRVPADIYRVRHLAAVATVGAGEEDIARADRAQADMKSPPLTE